MSRELVVNAILGAAGLGLFAVAYVIARLVTLPASPRPAPATQDLGEEPPAVVSLLVNRWDLTEDAAESTLLDLAARGYLEIRQPGNDPMQTTIHPRDGGEGALTAVEQRVLDRVRGLAVGGVVPVTALTFRNAAQAKAWNKRARAEVVADARRRGLSRRRFTPTIVGLLVAVAAVAALIVALAVFRHTHHTADTDDDGGEFAAAFFTFILLAGIAAVYPGERDTRAGREVASRWLGVRDWLRGHDAFADLPPASVAVWDRYLAYGAAVGATRVASAVLDLGMGNRKLVWSCFGGTWHRVRVRYPKFWKHLGETATRLVVRSVVAGAIGFVLVRFTAKRRAFATDLDPSLAPDRTFDLVERIGFAVGVILLAYGGYTLLRTLIDLAAPKTVTGEVLWQERWRTRSGGENSPPIPVLHYLAVDDGTADRTVAWALPDALSSRCHDTDTVTIVVRRWSRRVLTLTVVERGQAAALRESTVDENTDRLLDSMAGGGSGSGSGTGGGGGLAAALRAPALTAGTLLTAEEVTQALSLPVKVDAVHNVGPIATATYATVDRGRTVLMVQVLQGGPGSLAWKANSRGTALPGVADGAFLNGDRSALRSGDYTVVLTLMRDGKGRHGHLPWLLARLASRLTR